MRGFIGEGLQKVDGKGRVSIPVGFRRALEAESPDRAQDEKFQVTIVYGDDRRKNLECYTDDAFQQVVDRFRRMPRKSPYRQLIADQIIGKAIVVEIDPDGRFVLPPKCREKAGITDEAYFIANGDTFQIWRPDVYETEEAPRIRGVLDTLPPGTDIMSLLDEPEEA